MRYEGDINTAQQVEINVPRGAAQYLRARLKESATGLKRGGARVKIIKNLL